MNEPVTPPSRPNRTGARRRGRAAVLWAAVCFAALQVAYHDPLSYWCPQLHDVEYGNKLASLRARLGERSPGTPFVLGLGSSFTGMGLRPAIMDGCRPTDPHGPLVFNFAINSGGLPVQQLCLNRLLDEGIRPDWVFVEISPYFLFKQPNLAQEGEYLALPRVQARDLPTLARYHADPPRLRREWRHAQAWPWLSHRHLLQNWLLPRWIAKGKRVDHLWRYTDAFGWEAFPDYIAHYRTIYRTPKWVADQAAFMAAMNQQPLDPVMQRAAVDLVMTCRQAGLGVTVVRVPESTYVRLAYCDRLRGEFERFYANLRETTGVQVVDASAWVDDAGFVEGMHLAPDGAAAYSRRLGREVRRVLATGPASAAGPP